MHSLTHQPLRCRWLALLSPRILLYYVDEFDDLTIDIAIHAKEILKVRERLNAIYTKHTRQSLQRIERCIERDMYMSPDEAKEFGIVDKVPIALVSDAVESGEKEMKEKDEGSSP
ncbi:uncharacterized protein A4U43_C09F3540 [Asparagus officinalis]|uniref:ATP-dependent Clp protease proteolytic subunit n=1 Tax=Asparagus officinalis TaxID=4686 RepID=A0A5P1E8C3_ASPOF|nr:uncharacterized protein A4U43_C09F3540 [Asparagus officinalis]